MAFNIGAKPVGILERAVTGNIFVEKSLAFMNEGDKDGYNVYKHDIKNPLQARSIDPMSGATDITKQQAYKRSLYVYESTAVFNPINYEAYWKDYQPTGEFQWQGLPAEVQASLENLFLGSADEASENELTNGGLITGLIPQLESNVFTPLSVGSIAATGTLTLATAVNTNTATINGLVYTGVTGAKANNTQFSVDTSDTAAALDLADSINNDVRVGITIPGTNLSATSALGVVTVTSTISGVIGNAVTLVGTVTTIVASAATLLGGLQGVINEATSTQIVDNTAISFRAHGGGTGDNLSEILTSFNIFDKLELLKKNQTKAMRKRLNRKYMVSFGTADLIREAQRLRLNFKGVDVSEEGVMRYAGIEIIENPSFPDDTILFCSMSGDMKSDAIQLGTSMSSDFNNLAVDRITKFNRNWGMVLTFALDIFVVRPEEVCFYTPTVIV